MAATTARRKQKRLTACYSQVQSEVWIPQLLTPSPALTFILKLLVTCHMHWHHSISTEVTCVTISATMTSI